MDRKRFLGLCTLAGALAVAIGAGCGGGDDDEPGRPDPCGIAITSPEAGESFTVPPLNEDDELVTIAWDASGGGNVRVELLKGGAVRGDILASTPNDGYYFWRIDSPDDLALLDGTGDDYAVRLTALADTTCTDTSDPFRIWDRNGCAIEVAIDYPGSSLEPPDNAQAGDPMTISWVPTNTTGSYDIDFFQAFGSTPTDSLAPIAFDVSGDVYDPWIMTSFHTDESGNYAIRVRDHENPDCYGYSPVFTLDDPDICIIDVLQPLSAHSPLTAGTVFEIIWDSTNNSGALDIKLRTNTLEFVGTIAEGVNANLGAYSWTVSDYGFDGEPDQQFRIFIYDAADVYCEGRSGSFRILQAP